MSNGYNSFPLGYIIQRCPELDFTLTVKIRHRFIHNYNIGSGEQSSCYCKTLLLSSG